MRIYAGFAKLVQMLKVRRFGFREAFIPLWIALACLSGISLSEGQTLIPRIEKMPNLPQPYELRDWHQVTRDYLEFILDFDKRGEHLPLMRWKDESKTMIWMPAYVGNPDGPESINYLAAVVSGSLVGLDMRTYHGHDWVAIATNFFSPRDGVFLDWTKSKSGSSFWYDVLPNVLFFQLADLYPDDPGRTQLLLTVAERWYQALVALGGSTSPPALPNFDHTGFNLRTMQPFDNGHRIEPEGAAGIAFIEYLAWRKFKDARYLTATDWAIRALEKKALEANPLYEVLLPYAALTAARMNAELGRHYDVPRLVNWCFEPRPKPQARPNWGVITDTWNGLDVHGLVGSATDGGGYAFAMNTFQYAGTMAPLARYDDRYAHDLGKWILNLANAARLFYPNAHDAAHQSSYAWASAHDPESIIAYEGLRKWKRSSTTVALRDYATRFGRIKAGTFADTHFYREDPAHVEILEEAPASDYVHLQHVWEFALPDCSERFLVVAAEREKGGENNNAFVFSYAPHPEGPYTKAFVVQGKDEPHILELPASIGGKLYLKAESTDTSAGRLAPDRLRVDAMAISHRSDITPYAQGDQIVSFIALLKDSTVPIVLYRPDSAVTDLGLYGSSHVGNLGGIIKPTNVEKILQIDLLQTDYSKPAACPTYLLYNPYEDAKTVEMSIGEKACDVYDAVSNSFLLRNFSGTASFSIPADTARVVVLAPAGGKLTHDGSRTLINGIVVDYQ